MIRFLSIIIIINKMRRIKLFFIFNTPLNKYFIIIVYIFFDCNKKLDVNTGVLESMFEDINFVSGLLIKQNYTILNKMLMVELPPWELT